MKRKIYYVRDILFGLLSFGLLGYLIFCFAYC